MFMFAPGPNYPLTNEALTGEGGGIWSPETNLLTSSPVPPKKNNRKVEIFFSCVPCSPTFSLFVCSPQKLHLVPLFP